MSFKKSFSALQPARRHSSSNYFPHDSRRFKPHHSDFTEILSDIAGFPRSHLGTVLKNYVDAKNSKFAIRIYSDPSSTAHRFRATIKLTNSFIIHKGSYEITQEAAIKSALRATLKALDISIYGSRGSRSPNRRFRRRQRSQPRSRSRSRSRSPTMLNKRRSLRGPHNEMPVSPVKHSVSRSQSPATSIRNKYRGLENTESNDYTMRSAIESNDRLNFEELERGRVEIELERWCTEHGFVARVQVDEINGTTNGFRGIVFVDDEMIVSEGVKETQKEAREAAVASAMDLLKDRVKLNFGEDYVNSNDAAKTAEPTEWDHTVSASPHDTSSSTTLTHPPPSADPIIPQQVPFLASPPDSNLFPLHYAAYTGNLSQIRHLLSGAQKTSAGMPIGIHVPDPTHRLPVSYLAQCSDPKIRNAAWIDEAVDLLTTSATNTSLPPLEIVNYIDAGAMSPLAWSLLVDAHIARALDADKRGVPEFALVAGGGWVAKVVVSRLSQVLENCGADMRAKRVGTTCAHWLVREAVEGRGRSEGVPWVLAVWAARKTGFDVCALDIQGREAIEYVEASSMFKESLFFVREKFGGRSIGKV